MKKVQHEESATWKQKNMKRLQHGKKCNMKRMQHKKVQHKRRKQQKMKRVR